MAQVRWRLDAEGRITHWNSGAVELFGLLPQQVLGRSCAEVVGGCDSFARPLCARCPVQREIRYGAYQASTALVVGGKRLTCQGYADDGLQIELRPENVRDAREILASLSWAVRKLTHQPERLFQTLQVFLAALRKQLGMEAAELFLADPREHYLVLTAYDGVHREAFLERPFFCWGEGYPGIVALGQKVLSTRDLPTDGRYLRQKVKQLGYRTYLGYPLELPQGLMGVLTLASRRSDIDEESLLDPLGLLAPMLATSLYTVLTRLGEKGLLAMISSLHQGNEAANLESFLGQAVLMSGASCVRLSLANQRSVAQGRCEVAECAFVAQCPVWQGQICGIKTGLTPCPHTQLGRPRYCLPLWSGGQVVGVQQFHFARLPQPPSQTVAPVLWLQRLGAEVLWPGTTTRVEMGPPLEVYTFGGLQVRREGERLTSRDFGRRQTQTLLRLLIAQRGQTLSSEEICSQLWPQQDPGETQKRLHVLVHALRQVLEADPTQPQLVLREGEGYRLATRAIGFLDVEQFELLLHQGDGLDGMAALEAYRQALALYKGDFLADEPYADWAELERAYLRERAVGALFRMAFLATQLNLLREAQEVYRRILILDPWREEAYAALIQMLLAGGQEPEARSLFNQYRVRMEREGLPVSARLAALVRVSA